MKNGKNTSWQPVAKWYNKLVGDKGQYYHEHVVIPGAVRLLSLQTDSRLLDIGCGQGILARSIPNTVGYTGIDTAPSLIEAAKKADKNPNHVYKVDDATRPLLFREHFSHAAIILALQNMEDAQSVIGNCETNMEQNGKLIIVLNHPAFRIPRQTGWGIDEGNKLQYRKVNRYLSPLKIPIDMHPGQKQSSQTWSFHFPISYYVQLLVKHGFVIDALEEWASDKESQGKAAKMENRARAEIPLFLAMSAIKL